jgi:hypothetical protein
MCTGFDAPHDSLEFKLIRRSLPLMREHLKRTGLHHNPCGSLVVARSPAEVERLQGTNASFALQFVLLFLSKLRRCDVEDVRLSKQAS